MAKENFMVDLETYGRESLQSVVLSIGAVPFDHTQIYPHTFHAVMAFDMQAQIDRGRIVEEDTVKWWSEQSPEAREVFKAGHINAMRTLDALEDLARYMGANPRVWGNGSDFDNAILRSLYRSFNLPTPWHYTGNRCFRTLKALTALEVHEVPQRSTKHNALEDARYQALCAVVICGKLGIKL